MPEYIVKTLDDRNLVIEADSYAHNNDVFDFYPKQESGKHPYPLASVAAHNVFAIVEEEAFQADFYRDDLDNDPDEEDETDDTCLHCRFVEFTESQEFFDAVADVVYALGEPDEPESAEVSE